MLRIGIDLGGTKIEAAALDSSRAIRFRQRIETPAGDYAGTIEAVAELVATAERETAAQSAWGERWHEVPPSVEEGRAYDARGVDARRRSGASPSLWLQGGEPRRRDA